MERSVLKRCASEQEKVAKLRVDMVVIKEGFPNTNEIKELFQETNKSKKLSKGGEYLVNDEEKHKERYLHSSGSKGEGEELLRPWVKTWNFPCLKGMTPQGWCQKQIEQKKLNCRDITLQGYNLTFKIKFHHKIQRT